MVDDPIVEEIHAIRRKMWKDCGEDMEKFLDMIKKLESKGEVHISSVEELRAYLREKHESGKKETV